METNRDYYSWSQHDLFKSSKLQFYKRYVLNESFSTPAFDKGKEFADFRETGLRTHHIEDPLLDSVSKAIPAIGDVERKIEVGFGEIKLLAFIDECSEDLTLFNEYKTGKNPWTKKSVDSHKQLDFYALCIYLLSGEEILPKCNLYWIETEEVEVLGEKKLMYTGHVEKFEKSFTIEDIQNIAADVLTTYEEIKSYEHEEIEVEDEVVDRYLHLLEEKKKVDNEIALIKLRVQDDLTSTGARYASNSKGRFSLSVRKTPIFSKELLTKQKKYKDEIDKLKKKEKDSPNCKYTETESILFKEIK